MPPRFGDWRVINAQALVIGQVQTQADGRSGSSSGCGTCSPSSSLPGLAYFTTPENWRRVAHIIADAIYKRLTGEDGYFDTRIVYVAETGPRSNRIKRLAIMDQDGANHRYLTDGRTHRADAALLALDRRRSPTCPTADGPPRVYLLQPRHRPPRSARRFPRHDLRAALLARRHAAWSSAVGRDGNTDIYAMDLRTRAARGSPTIRRSTPRRRYSPDGSQIVFNSDRGGSQQLYVMDADGANEQRISFGQGRYATPGVVAARRPHRLHQDQRRQFYIGVMHPDGSGERILTKASWSKDRPGRPMAGC